MEVAKYCGNFLAILRTNSTEALVKHQACICLMKLTVITIMFYDSFGLILHSVDSQRLTYDPALKKPSLQ